MYNSSVQSVLNNKTLCLFYKMTYEKCIIDTIIF